VTSGTVVRCVVCWSLTVLLLGLVLSSTADSEELVLFGAGSLREVMTQIATDYQARHGGIVRTEFGPSGLMRERIEWGERVDLFASADMGHPLKLREQGVRPPLPCSRAIRLRGGNTARRTHYGQFPR
jgi:ABC-type molybdate transport system substrate-binding protein